MSDTLEFYVKYVCILVYIQPGGDGGGGEDEREGGGGSGVDVGLAVGILFAIIGLILLILLCCLWIFFPLITCVSNHFSFPPLSFLLPATPLPSFQFQHCKYCKWPLLHEPHFVFSLFPSLFLFLLLLSQLLSLCVLLRNCVYCVYVLM